MTEDYERITNNYTKALAASMRRTQDALWRKLFSPRRSKEGNQYLHGARDAIHKITKTV